MAAASALWLSPAPLVLASKSAARRAVLAAAAIPLAVQPAELDERALEREAGAIGPADAAMLLARAKALAVAAAQPGRLVLGADQTLALDALRFSKPADRAAAAAQLRALSGNTHALHSAIVLAQDDAVLFSHCAQARLTMRTLSEPMIAAYLDAAGDAATASVGAYQIEGPGIHLFEAIEGDHFTILGLPLLPLLAYLRGSGLVAA